MFSDSYGIVLFILLSRWKSFNCFALVLEKVKAVLEFRGSPGGIAVPLETRRRGAMKRRGAAQNTATNTLTNKYLPTIFHFTHIIPQKGQKNVDLIKLDTLVCENNYVVTHTTPLLLDYM